VRLDAVAVKFVVVNVGHEVTVWGSDQSVVTGHDADLVLSAHFEQIPRPGSGIPVEQIAQGCLSVVAGSSPCLSNCNNRDDCND
jgi:hypothetical protein